MYSNVDSAAIRNQAALELMRYKMLAQLAAEKTYPSLNDDDINEILIVAGMPVIVPDEVNVPELDIINTKKEEEE